MRVFFGHNADGPLVALSDAGTVISVAVGNSVEDEPLALLDRALVDAGRAVTDVTEIAVDCGPDGFSSVRRRVAVGASLAQGLGVPACPTGFIAPDQAAVLPAAEFKKGAALTPIYDRAPNITTPKKKSPLARGV